MFLKIQNGGSSVVDARIVASLLLQAIPKNIFRASKGTVRVMSELFGVSYYNGLVFLLTAWIKKERKKKERKKKEE